jgi:hypothetical protein
MVLPLNLPELLEQYMLTKGMTECWVTVQDLRSFFDLDDSSGPAFAGFLQKNFHRPFPSCRYKVVRIERIPKISSPSRTRLRYLVVERAEDCHRPLTGK